MKLSEAQELFYKEKEKALEIFPCEQLRKYKLTWNNRKSSFGLAYYNKPEIQLSRPLTLTHSNDHVLDTIRHEIAHVVSFFVFGESGHGNIWKNVSYKLGNRNITRTGTPEVLLEKKWTLIYINGDSFKELSMHSRKLKDLKYRHLKNDKNSLGKLFMVETKDLKKFKNGKISFSKVNKYQ